MTVCPIVVVPSQALRTGGESPFSGGTIFFFYDSSWYNYAKSIFQSLNEMLNELFDILFFSKTEVIFENLSVEE